VASAFVAFRPIPGLLLGGYLRLDVSLGGGMVCGVVGRRGGRGAEFADTGGFSQQLGKGQVLFCGPGAAWGHAPWVRPLGRLL
jgi:hypothetical protein